METTKKPNHIGLPSGTVNSKKKKCDFDNNETISVKANMDENGPPEILEPPRWNRL